MRTHVWRSGQRLWRGHRHGCDPDELVPGAGNTRFAPLPEVSHSYASPGRTAALLESALHHASGPDPRIHMATLRRWALSRVGLTDDVRLVDLRDAELKRLGLVRGQLVATLPAHYPCTRQWAAALHARGVGGHVTHGLLWHSRQADLHARRGGSLLLADLLRHRSVEVAVFYAPPVSSDVLAGAGDSMILAEGSGRRLVEELASLLGVPIV